MSSLDLARIVCGLPEPTLLVSPEGKILTANQAAGELLGQTSVELAGRSLTSFVTDPKGATQYLYRCLRNSQGIPGGLQLQISDGRSIQCKAVGAVAQLKGVEACLAWIRLVPRESANNQIVVYNERLQALAKEIKAFQQSAERYRSEERWRSVFENSAIGVSLSDLNGRFIATNPVFQKMLGYTEEELQNLTFLDITLEEFRDANWSLIGDLLDRKVQQFQIEKQYRRKDGSLVWVHNNFSMVPGTERVPQFLMALSEDITERKRAEEGLRRSERLIQTFWSNSANLIFLKDMEGRYLFVNKQFEMALQVRQEQIQGLKDDEIFQSQQAAAWQANDRKVLQALVPMEFEETAQQKDGPHVSIVQRFPLFDAEGKAYAIGGVVTDITERKRQAALRAEVSTAFATGDNLRAILQGCTEAMVRQGNASFARIWTLNKEENVLELQASAGMYTQLDGAYSRVPVGKLNIGLIAQERKPHFTNDVLNDPRISDKVWAQNEGMAAFAGYPLVVEDRLVGVMALFFRTTLTAATFDTLASITDSVAQAIERKHSEEALRRSERYLTEAQRLTKTGSWAWTVRSARRIEGWHYWSEEMFRIFEFDPRQGPPTIEMWRQRIHAEDREQVKERIQKAQRDKGEYVNDYRILFPDGRLKYIHVIGNPVFNDAGEITEYAGTSMDLTEQKRTEEALRRSEAYLAEGQRLTHTGSWAYNPATKKALYWSDEMFRIHGLDPQQGPPTSEAFLEHVHPEDRESVHEAMCNAVQEKTEYEVEHRMILPNGTIRHVHALGHPVLNRSGDLVEIVGSAVDVTERKRAEEALRRSEAYLAEGQRLTHTGSWAVNVATHETLHSSAELTRLSGLDPEKGLPSFQEFFQRLHPEDQEHVLKTFQTLLQTGGDLDMHYRIAVPGSPVRYMHAIGHPVLTPSGTLGEYVGIAIDITERRRSDQERERLRQLEADLAHMNRVSMMGELTASLAHELNQPIAAAITDADTCLSWLTRNQPDLEEAREAATRMIKAGTRAAEIINGLRSFYRKGAPAQRELVDVGEIIREMTVLLRNEAARWSVSVHLELADGITQAMADRVQLQQVFMNLMLNAIEAMRETGGELEMRSQVDQDGLLLISVSDTGVGLPPENVDKIFDAFFTTKPQGTGMGLAITRSIIEAHGGRLSVTGNPGRGATFQFTLPPAEAAHN